MKTITRTLLLATGSLVSLYAHALSFGDIKSQSFLMEPLVAEVPITQASRDEIESLRLRVAGQAEFERFGLARMPFHDQVRFAIVQRAGSWLVEIRSQEAIREPYLAMPVEATWRGGRYVREYTIFLDPRTVARAPQAQARPPKAADQPQTSPPARTDSPPPSSPPAKREFWPVRRGETLWKIADQVRPSSVTTYQMMMALLRTNPEAFPDGNVNNLKAGARLRIPELEEITRLSARAARREFKAQTAKWRSEVKKPAPVVPVVVPETAVATVPSLPEGSPEPEPGVTPDEVGEPKSQLRIVAQEKESTSKQPDEIDEIEKQLLLAMEQTEADRLELRTLNDRVAEIQAEMMRMRRLVILKNEQIAALQAAKDDQPLPPRIDIDAVAPRPEGTPQPTEAPSDRPVVASVPAPDASLSKPAPEFQWWLWLAAAAMALAVVAIVAMMIRRRETDDYVPDDHTASATGDGPYAEVVARHMSGRPDAVAVTATGAGLPVPEEALAADDDGYAEALAEWDGQTRAAAGTDDTVTREAIAEETLSDAELASLARDLGDTDSSGFEPLRRSGSPPDDADSGFHDLDDFNLNLEPSATAESPQKGVDSPPPEGLEDDKDILKLRLELAQAYLEIGDVEGAKDILTQVVEEGLDGPEQAEARKLLESLG